MHQKKSSFSKRGTAGYASKYILIALGIVFVIAVGLLSYSLTNPGIFSGHYDVTAVKAEMRPSSTGPALVSTTIPAVPTATSLDIFAYNEKLMALANNGKVPKNASASIPLATSSTTASTSRKTASSTAAIVAKPKLWPIKTVYPNAGAILPFNRIVAYYGNFYSTQMGVLGEYPPDQMLAMLASTTAAWAAADPTTPVIPAIDYIAVTAQGSPGSDGKYRARMPASQIEKAISLADQVHGLVFLDIQVGLSNLQTEIPLLEQYLKLPEVELSIDPEFAMETSGRAPGTVIGTLDATDINFTATYLAGIVRENNLPPKILVVHRFTEDMVTNYKRIVPLPEVEIVMDMDGWGEPAKKLDTYKDYIAGEPVQFTGFKLFYKADLRPPSTRMLTPAELLKLSPQPSYIQYQ